MTKETNMADPMYTPSKTTSVSVKIEVTEYATGTDAANAGVVQKVETQISCPDDLEAAVKKAVASALARIVYPKA